MRKRSPSPAEGLIISTLRRRYLSEMCRAGGRPRYEELSEEAVARLSREGVRRLRELLKSEREALRDGGADRSADSLTLAIRGLDSRLQILDDLLR